MDPRDAQYLYKETRLNLEAPSAAVVNLRVASGAGRRSRKSAVEPAFEDENTFKLKYLATASAVYHRQWHDSPRSFLWRVLEDGHVLSVRAIDVCTREQAADAPLILNFKFDVPIQPGCVAFADPKEHDALAIHVIDQSSQLYTLSLRPDTFRRRSAVDAGLSGVVKVQTPKGLGFKQAHRLVAASAETLLISVNDGGLIRLDKTGSQDASNELWTQKLFNVQGWKQNLRSLLPFQGKHTIPYGKTNMEYSAATSMQVTSLGLDNALFAVTICLDHRMRIWNLDDGQIIYTGDILNAERTPQEVGKWSIDPSQTNLLQLTGKNRGQKICATFSPIGAGEFKFWRVIAKDTHTVIVEDLFPKETLIPVTPSSDVWTLADFGLGSSEEADISLWTLWKNNLTYRVQRLDLDRKNMATTWEENWEPVYAETGLITAENSGPCDPTDVTEKWLQLILHPNKFTKATLQTALSIYERGLGASREGNQSRGLAESICSVLGSTASLDRGSSGAMDYEQFRATSETQWRRFYRLLVELDRQRGEAIGLAIDPDTEMTWVVCTDLISAVRECSSLERLYHNLEVPEDGQRSKAALVGTALSLVDGFSDHFLQLSYAALRPELYEESDKTDLQRLEAFENKAGFWRGVTEEDCAQINDALGVNFSEVTDVQYSELMELIAAPPNTKSRNPRYPLTDFGRKLIIQGVQENVELRWKLCFSQLILLAHMEFDFDTEEDQLDKRLDVGGVFKHLVESLRRLELLRWLAKTEISVPLNISERRSSVTNLKPGEESQLITALEANVGHLLGFSDIQNEPLTVGITDLLSNLCAPDSDIEVLPPMVQCLLVKRERADLALGLAPFSDESAFSVYVQGRVMLALKDYQSAALCFREASEGMSANSVKLERHSSGLLDDTEWNLINQGKGKYYSHIVALFEKHRAYSYVIDFARLAIKEIGDKRDASFIKVDLLSRQFNAAVATSQFDLAHSSLQSMKDDALRHSSLRKLVDKMCEHCHNNELVALNFPGMQQDVDDFLTQRCKSSMDVIGGSPYHQLLYSWRIKHNNYRGAASVLFDRIQKLRLAGEGDKITGEDVLDTAVTKQYLLLINALTCVEPRQAWIYDESHYGPQPGGEAPKRKLVTLADIRKQYQDELDRIAAIQNNQFGFEADDVMDIA